MSQPDKNSPAEAPGVGLTRSFSPAGVLAGLLFVAILAAIWGIPWFVTQDGPSHVYNAHVFVELARSPNSPLHAIYEARRTPLPNVAGHVLLMALLAIVSPRSADRVLMTLTFAGVAGAVVWLRWRVAGSSALGVAGLLALTMSLSFFWILGFYNFLLGTILFAFTLGFWWTSRETPSFLRLLVLAGLLLGGYFCHPVSLALTAGGLLVLCAATPGGDRLRRAAWTAAAALPLVPLALAYGRAMSAGGRIAPDWAATRPPWDPRGWPVLFAADPFQLNQRFTFPFVEGRSRWFGLATPTAWIAVAVLLLLAASVLKRDGQAASLGKTRGWLALGALLSLAWVIAPDTLGGGHGAFFRDRILFLGLISLVPALDLKIGRPTVWIAVLALVVGAMLQVAFLWEYALNSNRLASEFLQARDAGLAGLRIQTLLVAPQGRFTANPLTHIDAMLGIGTGNALWDNYEARQYFFNVQFRPEVARWARELGRVDHPAPEPWPIERVVVWDRLASERPDAIDALILWGSDRQLDAAVVRRFGEPAFERKRVRVFRRLGTR